MHGPTRIFWNNLTAFTLLRLQVKLTLAELLALAGSDEGLPSLCLPVLVYMDHPYRDNELQ
jgi:hypothetical protein